MAFCPNCGKELPDGTICDCQNNNNTFGNISIPAKPNNKNQLLTIGIAAIAVIVVVVLLVSSLGGGYKKPVKDLVDSLNKGDSAKMFSAMIPKKKLKEFKKEMKDSKYDWNDLIDKMDDALESANDLLEDEYGKNVKYSVKFIDKKKVKGDDLDDIEEDYEDNFDAEISKAYRVKVEMKVKGKKDEDSNTAWLYIVKVKGDDWKISTYDDETGITNMFGSSLF